MIKYTSILVLIFLILNSCISKRKTNSISCNNKDGIKELFDSLPNNQQKLMAIHLNEGFSDTLEIYLNGILYNKGFYKTNLSLSRAGEIVFDNTKTKSCANVNLIIRETNNKYCLDINLKKGYRIVSIYHLSDKWHITYTNKKNLVYE